MQVGGGGATKELSKLQNAGQNAGHVLGGGQNASLSIFLHINNTTICTEN